MSETGRIIRKFERMLGTSNIHEVRPDTKGALRDEIELSKERYGVRQRGHYKKTEQDKIIGHFVYDFENKTEKFVRYKGKAKYESKSRKAGEDKIIGHFVYDFENKTEKFVRYNEGDEKKD